MVLTFTVPLDSDLLIQQGQSVDFDTPLYKTSLMQTVEIDLATKLSTDPKNIFQHLKKFVGEGVKKGDLIAQSSSLLSNRSYYSEQEGIIKEIDHARGILILEATTSEENIRTCYFKGEVAEIEHNKIKLKVKHAKDFELTQTSDSFGGQIIYSQDPIKGNLNEEEVDGKVVVDDKVPAYEQAKYDALGAIGFVSTDALSEQAKAPNATLKSDHDYKSIVSVKLPYCIIDKDTNTIYFYE